jgi:hypothetical protein
MDGTMKHFTILNREQLLADAYEEVKDRGTALDTMQDSFNTPTQGEEAQCFHRTTVEYSIATGSR